MSDEEQNEGGSPEAEQEFAELSAEEMVDEDVDEELGEALAEAALADADGDRASSRSSTPDSGRKSRRGAREARLSGPGDWTGIDRILVAVLVANILLMAALVFLPGKDRKDPPEVAPQPGEQPPVERQPKPKGTGRAPVVPRHELWDLAWEQATNGELDKAIATLHKLLDTNTSMTKVVRRTVYLNLAQLYGRAGKLDESDHYFNLANSDFVTGLIPEDLWKLAEETYSAERWADARRYAARFLLQKKQMPKDLEKLIPLAYLRLADGYRNEARGPSTTRDGGNGEEARK